MGDLLDLGVVAARSGMTASALRYYERQEIITSSDRKGLRRQYRADVLETLAVVANCQRAGFTLADIRAQLATGGRPEWKDLVARKRDEQREHIEEVTRVADELDHALTCRSPNVFECQHFQAALQQALPVHKMTSDHPIADRG
jgi:MerR family redox-sensitive transcriptional activator SoxR